MKLAISPCPNDTFAFYYFIKRLTDNGVSVDFLDIEELNQSALREKYDIVKASYAILPRIEQSYTLLHSGSAIGMNVGPILVSNNDETYQKERHVLLPGENTTAAVLFQFYADHMTQSAQMRFNKHYSVFSEIIPALQSGSADLGVVIHEGRFVYEKKGLRLVEDLGKFWITHTGYAIPLGGVFVRSGMPAAQIAEYNQVLYESIHRAMHHFQRKDDEYTQKILPFMRQFAGEQADDIIEKHVETYVTTDTEKLSAQAHASIEFFTTYIKNQKNHNA